MTFTLHQDGAVMLSQITRIQRSNIHPLAHICDSGALVFISCAFLTIDPKPHHVTASYPSPGDNQQTTEGGPIKHGAKQKWLVET